MEQQELEIINYVNRITNGLINLTPAHASEIRNICNYSGAYAEFYRYNGNNKSWEFQRKINTTDVEISVALIKKDFPAPEKIYKYVCYDSKAVYKGTIFTSNNNLF